MIDRSERRFYSNLQTCTPDECHSDLLIKISCFRMRAICRPESAGHSAPKHSPHTYTHCVCFAHQGIGTEPFDFGLSFPSSHTRALSSFGSRRTSLRVSPKSFPVNQIPFDQFKVSPHPSPPKTSPCFKFRKRTKVKCGAETRPTPTRSRSFTTRPDRNTTKYSTSQRWKPISPSMRR